MPYNLKYYLNFKDLNQNQHLVQIYESATGTTSGSTEIRGVSNPFIIDYPERKKFDTVIGSGCEINLLSTANMMFFTNLYTNDPQKYQIQHYINGSINWYGYINSELFRESFSTLTNYPVQLTGNDGFSLMDRYKFVDGSGNAYTGYKSYYDILTIIFTKIGLPFNELRVATTTSFAGYSGLSGSTIYKEMYINCANFYNEDGIAMTMREVLDELLKPFQAFMFQDDGFIYLNDYNNIATNSSITYKRYTMPNLVYTGTTTQSNTFVLTGTSYQRSSGEISTGGGINKQVIAYSPYVFKDIIPECIKDASEFAYNSASYTQLDDGGINVPNVWHLRTLTGNTTMTVYTPAVFQQSYYKDPTSTDVYLKFVPTGSTYGTKIASMTLNPTVSLSAPIGNKSIAIKVSGKIFPRTRVYPYTPTNGTTNIYSARVKCQLKIGTNYLNNGNLNDLPYWNTSGFFYLYTTNSSATTDLGSTWNEIGIAGKDIVVNIPSALIGAVSFDVYNEATYMNLSGSTWATNPTQTDLSEIWLSDLQVSVIDGVNYKDLVTTDIEYQGYLDKYFQNEGEKITLKVGTDSYLSDKAKITDSSSTSITSFSRGSNSTKKIESLLLSSVISNYQQSNVSITGLILKNQYNLNNIITTPYFSGKQFCMTANKTSYQNAESTINLTEIFPDSLTV